MKCYLYILKSEKCAEYYIGSSDNPATRLDQHNSGSVKSTKHKKPFTLVFVQVFDSKDEARKAELQIKKWKRKDFIDKIVKNKKYITRGRSSVG